MKKLNKMTCVRLLALLLTMAMAVGSFGACAPGRQTEESQEPSGQSALPTSEPTEAPTEAPTDASTEAPTDDSVEAPTDASTEAPTDASTEAPTDASTEEPTDAPATEPSAMPDVEPVEVTLKVWCDAEDMVEGKDWMLQRLAAFEAAHPEYLFTWELGACANGDAYLMVTENLSNAADVFITANQYLQRYVKQGALTPIPEEYTKNIIANNSQGMVGSVTATDGKIYGFPLNGSTWFMYYDKSVFTEEDVKSLNTMLEKGRVSFPMLSAWNNGSFFFANGCTLFGELGNDLSAGIHFGGEAGHGALQAMIDVVNHPNFVREPGNGGEKMRNGEADACFSGEWEYDWLYELYGDNLGVAVLPRVEIDGEQKQMKAFMNTTFVAVNPRSDHRDIAMALADFLAAPESQLLRYELRGVVPVAKTLADHPAMMDDTLAMVQSETYYHYSVVQPYFDKMDNYWLYMGLLGGRLYEGLSDDELHDLLDQYVDQMNADG